MNQIIEYTQEDREYIQQRIDSLSESIEANVEMTEGFCESQLGNISDKKYISIAADTKRAKSAIEICREHTDGHFQRVRALLVVAKEMNNSETEKQAERISQLEDRITQLEERITS